MAKKRYPYRHDALLAPELPEQLILVTHTDERSTSPPPPALWSAVWPGAVDEASKTMLPHMGAVFPALLWCCCQGRSTGEGLCGSRWEAHPLCWSPGFPQPDSAFIAVTLLPHLLPSIVGFSFIRTSLQLPSWASNPSNEDKRGWNFLQSLVTCHLPWWIELSVLSLIVRSTSYCVYVLDDSFMAF